MTKNIELNVRGMSKDEIIAAKKTLTDLGWNCFYTATTLPHNLRSMAFSCEENEILDIPANLKNRISDFMSE